jgi:hypothetical protein
MRMHAGLKRNARRGEHRRRAERSRPIALTCAIAVILMGSAIAPLRASISRCPERLPGPHAGFERSGPIPAAHWLLWGMKLFDGRQGKNPPPEFAPDNKVERSDGITLVWRFTLNQDLLMVCIYNGSGTYYYAHRKAPPGFCVMDDDNGLTRAWCE